MSPRQGQRDYQHAGQPKVKVLLLSQTVRSDWSVSHTYQKHLYHFLEGKGCMVWVDRLALMTTEGFSPNIGNLFSELKLITDNLLFIYCAVATDTSF